MKRNFRNRILILLAVISVTGSLWYYRPVDIYTLSPDIEADIISISLIRSDENDLETLDNRHLRFERGDEDFDAMLSHIEALRFRRPPTNLLLKAFPFLAEIGHAKAKAINGYEYHIYIGLANEDSKVWDVYLSCWIDEWSYRDFERNINLSLTGSGKAKDAKALGDHFWAMTEALSYH